MVGAKLLTNIRTVIVVGSVETVEKGIFSLFEREVLKGNVLNRRLENGGIQGGVQRFPQGAWNNGVVEIVKSVENVEHFRALIFKDLRLRLRLQRALYRQGSNPLDVPFCCQKGTKNHRWPRQRTPRVRGSSLKKQRPPVSGSGCPYGLYRSHIQFRPCPSR